MVQHSILLNWLEKGIYLDKGILKADNYLNVQLGGVSVYYIKEKSANLCYNEF